MKIMKKAVVFAFFLLIIVIIGCNIDFSDPSLWNFSSRTPSFVDPYFISGTKADQDILEVYFSLLASGTANSEEQFALIRDIAYIYLRQREFGILITFLNGRVHEFPDDPYNTYYLFMIAFAYQQMEAFPMAALYFDRIIKNYPDLTVQGSSIHLASLNQLIAIVDNPLKRVWYYEELVLRFLDHLDPGPVYFMLAQVYEAIGEWENAIRAYTQYLPYIGSNVPGFPNADNHARHMVSFNNSARDWTFRSLDELVGAIKSALDAGSPARLLQYHAKVNFFTRTWEGEERDNARTLDLHLADFMRGLRIRYADSLDISSNANEAYLRTWGWANFSAGWYLYFRKIYFPLDPSIHGNWEWAGIYFGERF